jgi:hypothetical protein
VNTVRLPNFDPQKSVRGEDVWPPPHQALSGAAMLPPDALSPILQRSDTKCVESAKKLHGNVLLKDGGDESEGEHRRTKAKKGVTSPPPRREQPSEPTESDGSGASSHCLGLALGIGGSREGPGDVDQMSARPGPEPAPIRLTV